MSTKLLTIPETADELGISPNTVYKMIACGDLRAVVGRPIHGLRFKNKKANEAASFIARSAGRAIAARWDPAHQNFHHLFFASDPMSNFPELHSRNSS